ncbi:hypothetical protein [Mesorhizobium sp. SARCC-RB16n]|nr:hypothetical protein [Mesorhizobium sp. SARCC-RB16n]
MATISILDAIFPTKESWQEGHRCQGAKENARRNAPGIVCFVSE